ncbi:MAG: DMT family transporter [Desulfobulbaceae bacterium]|nr:DMT family transporter [Desulfobulbaceae bacterium]
MKKSLPIWGVHCLMLLSTLIVSTSFTVGKAITHGLDPVVLVLVRYILAAVLFAPIVAAKHGLARPPLRRLCGYFTISAATVGFFWCMFASLRFTSALNTSVIFTLVPGISGLYSALFLHERLGRYRLTALLLGMFGALWVIFQGDINRLLELQVNQGDLIFLTGCFLMAAYPPLVKKLHREEPMTVMTFWVLATGVVWLFFLALPRLADVSWTAIEMEVWAGIFYLAIFSTIITFYLTFVSTMHLGPTRVMAYSYFYPAFVLIIDWAFGHGLPPLIIYPGIIVVTLATIVLQRGARLHSQPPPCT